MPGATAIRPSRGEGEPGATTVTHRTEKPTPTPTQERLGNKIKEETAKGTIDPHDIFPEILGEQLQAVEASQPGPAVPVEEERLRIQKPSSDEVANLSNQEEARDLEGRKIALSWQCERIVRERPYMEHFIKSDFANIILGKIALADIRRLSADPVLGGDHFRDFLSAPVFRSADQLGDFLYAIKNYKERHVLSEQAISSLANGLLPAIESGDPQVAALSGEHVRGVWSLTKPSLYEGREGFGLADFIVKSYATEITPSNINELLMIAREVPTTNVARFEKNRTDAINLEESGTFGSDLRDRIHDQHPEVNELLIAMNHFYDTSDAGLLEVHLRKRSLDPKSDLPKYFDRANYEVDVREEINGEVRKTKAIDVLRRLAKNTERVDEQPPVTTDSALNERMRVLGESRNGRTVSREILGETLEYVNSRLIDMMERGVVGIEPNQILALGWLEQQGHNVLQDMSYEDQLRVYKEPWFHSILRFQELTAASGQFDGTEFQNFLDRVSQADSDQTAYRLISKRALDHVSSLGRKYKEQGRTYRAGALWSGNTAHELIGLTDPKPAITEQGKKHREERLRKVTEPEFHPGD